MPRTPTPHKQAGYSGPRRHHNLSKAGQGGGLFGSSLAVPQPQQSGGLFGAAAASQPQQAGGLFGSAPAAQPQQTGGLFSGLGNTSQPQQSGGLFGQAAGTQPTGGLFGAGNVQTQQAQPQQSSNPFGGSLFGNPQSKPAAPSLFSTATTTQAQPSLFAPSATNPPTQQQPSLFNASTSKPNPFGLTLGQNPSMQAPNPLGGSLSMGQSTTTTTVPGVRIDLSSIRGTTRFSDLHEDLQKQILAIDEFISVQQNHASQCAQMMKPHAANLAYIPNDVEFVSGRVEAVETALDNDAEAVRRVKEVVARDVEDGRLSFNAIDALRLPGAYHLGQHQQQQMYGSFMGLGHHGVDRAPPPSSTIGDGSEANGSAQDIVGYFSNKAAEMSQALDSYNKHISEIEQHLRTVEAGTMARAEELMARGARDAEGGKEARVRELVGTLKAFEMAILNVAAKVGECREGVVEVTVGGAGLGGRR
ncbi:hypothetical protein H2199_003599 [Coniosporium tulheliwenetii]|uniref:Uncharacterized protein n=1 Tax=Coniosporium tulheliwenetii TaxID=3383036 RepID=A0ACC2ZA54_9PEZI|nr:hypothetical protein H2199_003599 [Cladosporium sp. JES 115]